MVTMAQTERRNALSAAMVDAIVAEIAHATNAGARALILRAEPGARTWSAGFAIDELPMDPDGAWPHPLTEVTDAIRETPIPVIAAVEGGAWGGGCEVALMCDLLVAAADAQFALTPGRLGVAYDPAALRRLEERLPAGLLSRMLITADPISATVLADLGIVTRLVAPGQDLAEAALDLGALVATRAPLTISAAKAVLADLPDEVIAERSAAAWMSQDYREGRAAFLERRPPDFTGR